MIDVASKYTEVSLVSENTMPHDEMMSTNDVVSPLNLFRERAF